MAAYEHMKVKPAAKDRKVSERLRREGFRGFDIVADVIRMCAMNLYLHGIGGDVSPVEARDALLSDGGERFDVVLANPPFGKRQSFRIVNSEGGIDTERQDYVRDDFTVNLDIFWLKDDDHIDPDSLPPPDEVAAEIVENLELALEKFRKVAAALAAPGLAGG